MLEDTHDNSEFHTWIDAELLHFLLYVLHGSSREATLDLDLGMSHKQRLFVILAKISLSLFKHDRCICGAQSVPF